MICDKCGKTFQTYSGTCPFCHNKNEKDTQEQPTIKYTPIVKPNPQVYGKPKNPTENIRSQSPVKNSKSSDKTFKYVLIGGVVLLVVLSAAVMAQSFMGGSPLSTSAPDNYISPTATDIPLPSLAPITLSQQPKITYSGSKAGTLSPYSGDSGSINPNPVAPDYTAPGHRYGSDPQPTEPTESISTGSNGGGTIDVYGTPDHTTVEQNPTSAVTNPNTIPIVADTKVTTPSTAIINPLTPTIIPPTATYVPPLSPQYPVILEIKPERSTVDFGDQMNSIITVESGFRPEYVTWFTIIPSGEMIHNNISIKKVEKLGNNQWNVVISEPTDKYWEGGDVQLINIAVLDQSGQRSKIWTNTMKYHINSNNNIQTVKKPVIVSIKPDEDYICAGKPAYFTVLVHSTSPVGDFGTSYLAYTSTDGYKFGSNKGLEYTRITENAWEGKIRILTTTRDPPGNIVLEKVIVSNTAEQSSDPWTIPVIINVRGCSGTKK
ncbi:MAG: hypothetical protein ABFC38_11570 [Methanospirillum sp.]